MAPPPPTIPKGSRSSAAPPPAASSASKPSSDSKQSPGFDLLGEALQLNDHQHVPLRRPPASRAAPSTSAGAGPSSSSTHSNVEPVTDLPADYSLKRGCRVTSASYLGWCTHTHHSVRAAGLLGTTGSSVDAITAAAHVCSMGSATDRGSTAADATTQALTLEFERAMVQWRHPAQRLPPTLVKQLVAAATGTAEKDYAISLNDAFDAALHSLFVALRDGRCPYFYCRAETPREASAASAGGFSVLWRNRAVSEDVEREGGPSAAPLGWAATDDSSCYAVLSPSSRVRCMPTPAWAERRRACSRTRSGARPPARLLALPARTCAWGPLRRPDLPSLDHRRPDLPSLDHAGAPGATDEGWCAV